MIKMLIFPLMLSYMLVLLGILLFLLLLLYFHKFLASRKRHRKDMNDLRYQVLVESLPMFYLKGRMEYSKDGSVSDVIITDGNYQVRKAIGDLGGQVGKTSFKRLYPNAYDKLLGRINAAIKKKLPYIKFVQQLPEVDMYYDVIILFDDLYSLHICCIDSTSEKKAHLEMEKKNKELKAAIDKAAKADAFKNQLIKSMSHEIRTPMNAIIGFSQLLSMPDGYNTAEEKSQYANYIESNANMLLMLIDDLLSLGDAENGCYNISISEASVNDICRKAINSVEFRCPSNVQMRFETDVRDDFTIKTDPRRVQQLLIHYLTNACKHTTKGEIVLSFSLLANLGSLSFSVTDTGSGVPPEMAEDIFERFIKANEFKQGVGLGLNVCSTIANKLNGKVYLDNSYKGGARFFFVLPAERPVESAEQAL